MRLIWEMPNISECCSLLIFPPPGSELSLTVSPVETPFSAWAKAACALQVTGGICPDLASCPGLRFKGQGPSSSRARLECPPFIPATHILGPFSVHSCGFVKSLSIFVAPVFVL